MIADMLIVYTLFFLCVPAGLLYLAHHQRWAQKLGVILLCYLTGLLVGNAGLIPQAAGGVQQAVSEITVALALPMLLFTVDIRQWSRMAGAALLSMLLATISVVTLATACFYIVQGEEVEAAVIFAYLEVRVHDSGDKSIQLCVIVEEILVVLMRFILVGIP